jgi:hypothetical protein
VIRRFYHSTVFPLKHVSVKGIKTYDAVRQIIFESIKDPMLNDQIIETLKWLVYEKGMLNLKSNWSFLSVPTAIKPLRRLL